MNDDVLYTLSLLVLILTNNLYDSSLLEILFDIFVSVVSITWTSNVSIAPLVYYFMYYQVFYHAFGCFP